MEFKEYKVKDIAEKVTDYVANGSFASIKENVTMSDSSGEAILIRLVDYNNGFKGPYKYIDEKSYEFLSKTKLFGDEILISNIGANAGTVFKVPKLNKKMSLGSNSILVKFKGDNNFFYYYLKSPTGQYKINSILSGSAQPKFNKTDFKNLSFSIPDEKSQKKIGDFLNGLDKKIDINKCIIKNLEQVSQTLFKRWFIDFEFPNEDGKPYKSSGGEMVESELGEIPKEWNITKLDELSEIISKGSTPRKNNDLNQNVFFLKVKDINDDGFIKWNQIEKISKEVHENQLKRSRLEKNDILISIAGTIGRISYINIPGLDININQAIAFIRCSKKTNNNYILNSLKHTSFKNYLFSNIIQGVQANISLGVIKKYKLIYPTIDIIGQWNVIQEDIRLKQESLLNENQNLENLRDTLLPKLLSGEIEIPEDLEV